MFGSVSICETIAVDPDPGCPDNSGMHALISYEAGHRRRQRHVFRMRFAGDRTRVVTVMRFFEFWAQANCQGAWRVEELDREIVFSIARDPDAIHFRLSDLYERYAAVLETVIPRMCGR